jgi:rubrerythrin
MTALEKDIDNALAAESLANGKYLAFARKAEKEGRRQAARLFRAAAESQAIHARNHLRARGAVRDTEENLKTALAGIEEFQKMYLPMMDDAMAAADTWATKSFCYAFEAGKVFARLLERARGDIEALEEADYHICKVCGFTVEGDPPGKCPVCGSRKRSFRKIE